MNGGWDGGGLAVWSLLSRPGGKRVLEFHGSGRPVALCTSENTVFRASGGPATLPSSRRLPSAEILSPCSFITCIHPPFAVAHRLPQALDPFANRLPSRSSDRPGKCCVYSKTLKAPRPPCRRRSSL
jgi:hypothetical protein